MVPVNVVSLTDEKRAGCSSCSQFCDLLLARDAEAIQNGYAEYQELLLSRHGHEASFAIAAPLALLLALLSALAASFLLSERLSAPLNVLVEGTRAVAQGDFSQRAADPGHDEIGMLTRSFNSMTLQLADARGQAERKEGELTSTRRRSSRAF